MIIELPVRSDVKAYDMQVELDGVVFTLNFRFNFRMGRWLMDIATAEGIELINGVVLLTGVNLNDYLVVEGMPPGVFTCEDRTGQNKNAGIEDLGNDVRLLYLEATA